MPVLREIGDALNGLTQGIIQGMLFKRQQQQDELARQNMERQNKLAENTLTIAQRKMAKEDAFMQAIVPFFNGGQLTPGTPPNVVNAPIQVPGQGPTLSPSMSPSPTAQLPQNMSDLVDWTGRYHGLDQQLWRNQIAAESGGNPNEVSPKGARGIAQIMPEAGKPYGLDDSNAFDPYKNLMTGAQIMKALKDKYGGDTKKALWGYNAGTGNVDKGVYPAETRDYIKKITGQDYDPQAIGTNIAANTGNTATDVPMGFGGGVNPNAMVPVGGRNYRVIDLANNPKFVDLMVAGAASGFEGAKNFLGAIESVKKLQAPEKFDGAQWFKAKYGRDFDPTNANEANLVQGYNRANSTQQVNISNNVDMSREKELQVELGKNWAKEYDLAHQDAKAAGAALGQISVAKGLLNKGMETDAFTPLKAKVAAISQALGIDPKNIGLTDATTPQIFQSAVMKNLLTELMAQKGPQTEGDAQRAMATFAQLGNTTEANKFILDYAEALAKRKQEYATFLYKTGTEKHGGDAYKARQDWEQYIQDNPILDSIPLPKVGATKDTMATPHGGATYKTPEEVRSAFERGALTKEGAASILQNQFGME